MIATLSDGGLRGLGGAGFPTGRKWGLVRAEKGPRLMAVNGDEGEPGTFKDRIYLEKEPHKFLEGMLIAAWAVEAEQVFIYMRDEYPAVLKILKPEIAKLEAAGLAKHTKVHVRRGAGAYICGEESAMIESIEGKRGYPRHRPPYVAQVGLFGRPTLVNNIETLYWVPAILEKGAAWFAGQGKNGAKGLRSYSVSGRVKNPGMVLTAAGSTCRDLIELCGGMADGHHFKGYLPGGASGGILPAYMADIPLDFGQLEKHGCFVGSHAVVILSDKDDMKAVALNLMRFFEDESCGQCTPCRNGTEKAVQLMGAKTWDAELLADLSPGDGGRFHLRPRPGGPNPVRSCSSTSRRICGEQTSPSRADRAGRQRARARHRVALCAGAETGEHVHGMDYVVVPLGDGRLKLVSPAGEESFADLKHGVSYARKAGVHHNVINANAFEYAFVEIELKS